MPIRFRTATEEDWLAICQVDGRNFGFVYTPEQIEAAHTLHDPGRFELSFDGKEIVAVVGVHSLKATVPGGGQLPMGGLTWVSTSATHRRQGLLTELMARSLADIDRRGEPLAMLGASEGGIYERYGFGIASQQRTTSIERHRAQFRAELRPKAGSVKFVDGDNALAHLTDVWSRFHRTRAGELDRNAAWHKFLFDVRSKPRDEYSPAFHLAHRDGYASYRIADSQPNNTLNLLEMVAITPEAHAALWHAVLGVDLVGTITSRVIPIDDPLPYLLTNPRALETTKLSDGVWANVRDVAACFAARTYSTTDRLVIEADGQRWAIDGSPQGATCKRVKSRPDLVMDHASLGALLFGGVRPSSLAAGRRLEARNAEALRRADVFFLTSPAPHCQTGF